MAVVGRSLRCVTPVVLSSIELGQTNSSPRWRGWRWITRPAVALVVVGFLYILAQAILVDLDRPPDWDEANYLSQVSPGHEAIPLAAHRARGIVYVVAPVSLAGAGIEAVRIWMVIASASLLVLAFSVWIPIVGWAAPLGAAMFAFTWLALFYGSEVYPNLLTALLAVAFVGLLLRHERSGSRLHLFLMGSAVVGLAFLRPPDAAVAVGLGVTFCMILSRRKVRVAAALIAGFLAGIAPWVIEAYARFGDPIQRLQYGRGPVSAGWTFTAVEHLRLLDGRPMIGPDPSGAIPAWGAATWIAGGGLVFVALLWSRSDPRRYRDAIAVPVVAGLGLALPYFVGIGAVTPRFLLPAYGLLVIPAALGVISTAERRRWVLLAPIVLIVGALGAWHGRTAQDVNGRAVREREEAQVVALALEEAAAGKPCAFVSQYGFPQIQYASGCTGSRLILDEPSLPSRLLQLADRGHLLFALAIGTPPDTSPLHDWEHAPIAGTRWTLYHHLPSG